MAKHIVITGCDRGIGKYACEMLTMLGHRLTIGVKNFDDSLQSQYGENVTVRHLDLASMSSVARFAEDIKDCHTLINNGAVMRSKVHRINGVEETMLTNYLGYE